MKNKSIKEIEDLLETIIDEKDMFISECKQDERKGVQQLVRRWQKKTNDRIEKEKLFGEMKKYELNLYDQGIEYIAGVDEVGRGPLAGPVVAAAVILPKEFYLPGINDSKKLSEIKRDELFTGISAQAISIGIGIIPAKVIDEVNIYQATKLAMKKAVNQLSICPEHLLVDAMEIPIDLAQTSIIKGDSKSISIAASSIIAKVTRDRLMKRLGDVYPGYGFEKHMGYGTAYHLEALNKFGITDEHRVSYSPVAKLRVTGTSS